MRYGKLTEKLIVQENRKTTKTTLGEVASNWKTIGTAWAEVVTLSGLELIRARQVAAEATHQVTIHYYAGLTRKHRFLWGDVKLDINHVNDVEQAHREMVCICKEAAK